MIAFKLTPEYVVRGLESCILRNPEDKFRCSECSYLEPGTNCINRLKYDALTYVQYRIPIEPVQDIMGNAVCGADVGNTDHFCRNCGKAVKWE